MTTTNPQVRINLESFDSFSEREDALQQSQLRKVALIARLVTSLARKSRGADVGCMTGLPGLEYLRAGIGALDGYDISDVCIQIAKSRGINARYWNADGEPCPAPDGSYDVVIASDVIEHLVDTDTFVRELYRVTAPGGSVIVSTANLASWYNRLRLLRGQVPVSFPAASPSVSADLMVDKNHIRVTTLGEWLHLFEAHGFLVRSTHGCAAYFEPWHGTAKIAAARLVGRFFERHPPLADLVLWVAVKPSASPAGVLSQRPQVTPDWGRAAPAAWRLARGLMALPRFKGRDRLLLALRRYMKPPEGPVTIPLPDGTMVRGHLGDEIDAQLYVYRTYEPITSGVLRQCVNSGDTVLDVGANIGVHTLALAGKVGAKGSVHAFEPNPGTFERLVQNVNVNAFTNVRLNQLALGADESEVQLVQQWSNRSGDAMLVPGGADVQHEGGSAGSNGAVFTVRQTTLDAYCQEHGVTPALLKVDVEGGEMNVLRGAQRVLGAVRPTLLVEYNARTARKHGNDPGAVFSWLEQQFNYELFFVNDAGLEPYAHVLPRLDPSSASGNVLCLRSEEAALVSARINAHYPEVPRSHAALELWPPE